mgnify:FL=1
MSRKMIGAKARKQGLLGAWRQVLMAVFLAVSTISLAAPEARAQSYSFSSVQIEGNQRVDAATILSYAGIGRGQTLTQAELNDAYQRIVASGLFESVELVPQGGRLLIRVVEYPTISVINFEGNARIKDEDLAAIIRSQSRRVYSPRLAEADAAAIVQAYEQMGRLAATVEPRIIRRSENRVDLVFEITEGAVVEIERISFVGNRSFSERRLRRVLQTKQAGLLRALFSSDTFIADRIEFDKQVLRDFYLSRGFVDFQVLSVSSELTRRRSGFLVTFNVREGQSFRFGELTASSDLGEVDPTDFEKEIRVREGSVYTPLAIENTIARLERLALRKGLNFIRVEPRITRNDRDLTLDVDFAIIKGPRVFVERIDIEGNATTLDRVIRRQFKTVEGDPFNPREIRESAERIRALGFFSTADVEAREGTSPDQVIVDVNVEEQPTGSLSFGLSYSVDSGAGATVSFSESNFLGRGQYLSFSITAGTDSQSSQFIFAEPAFLGRDVTFRFAATHAETDQENGESYKTTETMLNPSLEFPISESGRLQVGLGVRNSKITNYLGDSAIVTAEAAEGDRLAAFLGYTYSYDSRRVGLNPNTGIVLSFSQEFAGLGGDAEYIETTALAKVQTLAFREEVTLRAELEGGIINMLSGTSRVTDRYYLNGKIRGFESNGIGPRDLAATEEDALGGNMFAVARFEAEFPLGLPEEYGIRGGIFADVGSVWSLDNVNGGPGGLDIVDDSFELRAAAGVSIFWDTPIGPLRFNFSRPLRKLKYDKQQNFDLTISTRF